MQRLFCTALTRNGLSSLTLLVGVLLVAAGCTDQPADQAAPADSTDPSPSAPTMPPVDSVEVSEIPPDSATRAQFNAMMDYAHRKNLAERAPGEIVQALGTQFLGRPYLIGPLDQTPNEQLVCRLDGFDCFTFDEAMLAMAHTVKNENYSYDEYKRLTRESRYRNGKVDYCNRLHYYTEFVRRADEVGILRNITREIGGERLPTTYTFMSEHRDSYPQLESDSLYQCIQQVEDSLSQTMTVYHIPQDSIRAVYDQLKAGDLIATSTGIEGLDVTHTGMVYKGQRDTTGLLHASTEGGVKISPDLHSYVQSIDAPRQIGIIVARPVFGSEATN